MPTPFIISLKSLSYGVLKGVITLLILFVVFPAVIHNHAYAATNCDAQNWSISSVTQNVSGANIGFTINGNFPGAVPDCQRRIASGAGNTSYVVINGPSGVAGSYYLSNSSQITSSSNTQIVLGAINAFAPGSYSINVMKCGGAPVGSLITNGNCPVGIGVSTFITIAPAPTPTPFVSVTFVDQQNRPVKINKVCSTIMGMTGPSGGNTGFYNLVCANNVSSFSHAIYTNPPGRLPGDAAGIAVVTSDLTQPDQTIIYNNTGYWAVDGNVFLSVTENPTAGFYQGFNYYQAAPPNPVEHWGWGWPLWNTGGRSMRFVVVPPSQLTPYAINGTIYVDTNRNGTKDAGESAYTGGAALRLSGTKSATTNSNGSGAFSFTSLGSGSYSVALTAPGGYVLTGTNPR